MKWIKCMKWIMDNRICKSLIHFIQNGKVDEVDKIDKVDKVDNG